MSENLKGRFFWLTLYSSSALWSTQPNFLGGFWSGNIHSEKQYVISLVLVLWSLYYRGTRTLLENLVGWWTIMQLERELSSTHSFIHSFICSKHYSSNSNRKATQCEQDNKAEDAAPVCLTEYRVSLYSSLQYAAEGYIYRPTGLATAIQLSIMQLLVRRPTPWDIQRHLPYYPSCIYLIFELCN